jgi:Ion channel
MLGQVLVGGATSLANLCLHALLIAGCSHSMERLTVTSSTMPVVLQRSIVIAATGALLVAGHLTEVMLWAWTYGMIGAAPSNTDLLYFAFGNYTTLGYGDVLPVPQWRLLGPMTALNGIMLIGWSTALIFEVLRRTGSNGIKLKH